MELMNHTAWKQYLWVIKSVLTIKQPFTIIPFYSSYIPINYLDTTIHALRQFVNYLSSSGSGRTPKYLEINHAIPGRIGKPHIDSSFTEIRI